MKRLTSALLVISLLTSPIYADTVFVPLDAKSGLVIDSTGPVSIKRVPIQSIGQTPVDPDPDPNPTPDNVESAVATAAAKVNDALFAKGLATVYTEFADQLDDGDVSWRVAQRRIGNVSRTVIGESENPDGWNEFGDSLNDIKDAMENVGKLGSKDQQVAFLRSVAAGLNKSAEGAAIDLDRLTALIEWIIKIIRLFSGLFGAQDVTAGN